MAENLPFSIANILRPDFPHPSRISKVPSVLHMTPARERSESRKSLLFATRCRLVDRRLPFNETRCFGGGCLMHSASALGKLDVSQKSYDVKEQIENHLTGELMNKGNFEFQYL